MAANGANNTAVKNGLKNDNGKGNGQENETPEAIADVTGWLDRPGFLFKKMKRSHEIVLAAAAIVLVPTITRMGRA